MLFKMSQKPLKNKIRNSLIPNPWKTVVQRASVFCTERLSRQSPAAAAAASLAAHHTAAARCRGTAAALWLPSHARRRSMAFCAGAGTAAVRLYCHSFHQPRHNRGAASQLHGFEHTHIQTGLTGAKDAPM